MSLLRTLLLSSSLALLVGCAAAPSATDQRMGIDGVACVGAAPADVRGLKVIDDKALQARAQLASGKGGVCDARVFEAVDEVVVYRVYDASKPWSAYGGWWSLERPQGPRGEYAQDNAICPEWSALDQLVTCRIKAGSKVVLGTTQNVTCENGQQLMKNANIQVFMANDSRNNQLQVDSCALRGAWPV